MNELQLIFSALRCYIQSLAADLSFAYCASHSGDFERECVAKLDSDAAGFMRLSLRMYNLVEGSTSFSCSADGIAGMAQFVELFVKESVDAAILSPNILFFYGPSLGVLREHTVLLQNTLQVMAEEMNGGAGIQAAAQVASSRRKRLRAEA
jgi:hypothetical protein